MKYGRGYIPDRAGHRYTAFPVAARALGASNDFLAGTGVDLRPSAPAVMDQGMTGSCTGHGTATCIYVAFALAGAPLPWVPSPCGLYTVGRCEDRLPYADGSLPPLRDEGAQPAQVQRGAALWGIRATRAPAPDGRNSDCSPETINDEPTLGQLDADLMFPVVGAYEITGTTASRVAQIRSALAAGLPVGCGFFADAGFEDWTPADPAYGAPDESDPNGGGHWVALVGYRTRADGRTEFLLRNSWGTAWGDAGDCWVSEEFLGAAWQLIVFSVRKGQS